jgi:hypothetical protein
MKLKETGLQGVDWINLVHHRDKWGALGKVVVIFGFQKIRGVTLLAEEVL